MQLIGSDINDIYKTACKTIIDSFNRVRSRGLSTLEVINAHIELTNPRRRFVNYTSRNMSMKYFVGELCYYLDGRTDLPSISCYAKFWDKISDDGKTINSCYGNRIFTRTNIHGQRQFEYAVTCLKRDKYSRKAIMTIYNPNDAHISKDNPCTLTLQLLIRDDALHLIVNMRSEDVWLGIPYDVAFFTIVQEAALQSLLPSYPSLNLGSYYHNVTSLHIYVEHQAASHRLLFEDNIISDMAPPLTNVDVEDWFADLLTYEKSKRGVARYECEGRRTEFQDWCKLFL